jgi:hypothetical protein
MLPMTLGQRRRSSSGRRDVAPDLSDWECSDGASALGAGRPTGRWWSRPRQCTSRQRRRARHGWSRCLQKLLHVRPRSLPTQQSSRPSTSSSSGTSSRLLLTLPAVQADCVDRIQNAAQPMPRTCSSPWHSSSHLEGHELARPCRIPSRLTPKRWPQEHRAWPPAVLANSQRPARGRRR